MQKDFRKRKEQYENVAELANFIYCSLCLYTPDAGITDLFTTTPSSS